MRPLSTLEQDILAIFKDLYGYEFKHRLEVEHHLADASNPEEFILRLYLHDNLWCPLKIYKQCNSEKEFLDFLKEEFRTRNLIRSDFYKIRLDVDNDCEKGF